jgi:hypothetical protein
LKLPATVSESWVSGRMRELRQELEELTDA